MKKIMYLLIIASNVLHAQTIYEAIKKCDLNNFKSYLSGISPNIDSLQFDSSQLYSSPTDSSEDYQNSETVLMITAEAGCLNIVKYLIEKNADINKISPFGWTALKLAVNQKHKEIVEFLIKHGAKVNNSEGEYGAAPISWAAFNGDLEIVKILIKAGADVNKDVFMPPIDINNCTFFGGTPVMFAAVNGHEQVVKELIKAGADVNLDFQTENIDALGFRESALTIAAQNNYLNIVNLLIKNGAHAFETLVSCGFYKALDKNIAGNLIKAGVKINNQDNNGMTPLMVASWKGNINMVKLLIDNNVDIKIKENNNITAFMLACYSKEEEIAKILFDKGAVTNTKEANFSKLMDVYAWNTTTILNTPWAYSKYVKLYPEGSGIPQVKGKLKELEFKEWEKTRTANTIQAYKEFLKNFPDGDFRAEANARIKGNDKKEPTVEVPEESVENTFSGTVKLMGFDFARGGGDMRLLLLLTEYEKKLFCIPTENKGDSLNAIKDNMKIKVTCKYNSTSPAYGKVYTVISFEILK